MIVKRPILIPAGRVMQQAFLFSYQLGSFFVFVEAIRVHSGVLVRKVRVGRLAVRRVFLHGLSGRFRTENHFFEGVPHPVRHHVVQNGIEGGRKVVEDARDAVHPVVYSFEVFGVFEVDGHETLGVKWGPTHEETEDHESYNEKVYHLGYLGSRYIFA